MKDYPLYGMMPTRRDDGWSLESRIVRQNMIKIPPMSGKMKQLINKAQAREHLRQWRLGNGLPNLMKK